MRANEFGPDGTGALPPPRLFPDPLAGLVTADTWIAPQWTSGYSMSRVSVPTPLTPTEQMRQAVRTAMEQEQRTPGSRRSRAPRKQAEPPQQQQQQQRSNLENGVTTLVGCLIVIGVVVLAIVGIVAIFS